MTQCPQCEGLGYLLLAKRVPGIGTQLFMGQCLLCNDHVKFKYALNYAAEYGHEPPEPEVRAAGNESGKVLLFAKPGRLPNPYNPLDF